MNKSKLLPYFILIIILFATSFVKANTITTAGSGNWNSTAFNAPWPGGIVPASTDNVIIASGDNVAVTVAITQTGTVEIQSGGTLTATAANATVGPLTIDIGGTLTTSRILTVNGVTTISGTINFQTTARADAFNGDVTLISGATWSETVAITPSFSGNFSNNASTFTASTGVHTFSGSGKTFSGSTTTTIPRVTITGTYSNTGTLTVATALAGSGTLTNGAAGTLNIGCTAANLTITALDASTPNNTVNYNRAGVQTVFVTPYYNLTLSGSGAKTIGAVSVSNILDMTGTASASAAPTYGGSATLQYDQTATTGPEWISPFVATGGVIINSGTVTLGAAKVIGNNTSIPLKIVSSATLTPGANLLTFDGDFINAGTLTSGSGGVTITGTVTAQNIAGFTTTGTVSCTKTSGTATFTGNVNGAALIINGPGGTLDLGTSSSLTHTFTGVVTLTNGTLFGDASTLYENAISAIAWGGTGVNFSPGAGTVYFNAAGAQTISATGTSTFNNLYFSNSGAKTTPASIVINGNWDVTGASAALNTNNTSISVTGNITGSGNITSSSGTITVGGAWSNTGTFTAGTGTVTFNGASQNIPILNYYNLTLSGGSGTTEYFQGSTTINGTFSISSGVTDDLGTYTSFAYILILGASNYNSGCFGGPTSSGCTISPYFASDPGILYVGSPAGLWMGTNSTDWNDGTNWYGGSSPSASTDVIINTASLEPTISSTGGLCRNITINSGATLTIDASYNLTVSGNWTNNGGTLTVGSGTVIFNGTAQTIGGSAGTTFYNLTTSGTTTVATGIATTIGGALIVDNGTTFSSNATYAFTISGTTTVGGGSSGTLAISTAASGIQTFTGAVTINSGGNITETVAAPLSFGSDVTIGGTLTESGAAVVGIAGSLMDNGTYTASSGVHTFSGSAKTIGGSAASITIPSVTFTGNYTNNGILTCATLLRVTGAAIRLTNNGTINATTALSGNGGLTQGATGILNIGAASAITTIDASTYSGNTVNYNGTLAQTVKATSYYNLGFSGAHTTHNITINGVVAIAGNMTNTATFTSGNFVLTGSTITFNGSGAQIIPSLNNVNYNNLTINQTGSGNATLGGASALTTVNGNLIISSGSLTIPATNSLTVGGTTTLGSAKCLVIQSNASSEGSFIDNGFSGSGSADVQRYVKNSYGSTTNRWEYVSSPITTASSTIFTSSLHNLWYADETMNAWDSITDASPQNMAIMQGYCRDYVSTDPQSGTDAGNTTYDFIGKPNTGSYSISVTRHESAPYTSHGWNLVGNPYPSAIDWDASTGWNNTNIISSIYFRSDGNYGTYIAGHGGLGTNGATNIIPPMQSFWVRVDTQQTTGSLGCDNSVRVHSSQNIYRVGLSSYNNTLHLTATNNTNGLSDDTYIIFDPSATDGFDSQYDAYKMFAVDPAYPQVYTNIAGSGDISINSLSALVSERIIPLGFNASVSGQYTFTAGMVSNFTNNGNTVFLKDLNTGTYQDLSSDSVYQFTSGVTSGLSRFLLYFNKSSGIDEHSTDQIQIFSNNNQVYLKSSDMLNGDATVYDVLGQIIATKHLSGESSAVINLQPVSAVYIVKYTANDITITKRIFINK